jgi:hypothetical protein
MNYYSEEDLDRALAALALEMPPPELRASILSATVYRAPAIVTRWEFAGLAAVVLAIGYVLWLIASGGAPLFTYTIFTIADFAGHALTNMTVLAWLATGFATAVCLSLSLNAPTPMRERIAKR